MRDPGQATACPLERVLATEKLRERPSRSGAFAAENRALARLAEALTGQPARLLETLASSILECCRAESAGISILEDVDGPEADVNQEHVFRVQAAAGASSASIDDVYRQTSPCELLFDREQCLLFEQPQRHFLGLRTVRPPIEEALVIPFFVDGRPKGVIWALTHSASRRFDLEDARLLDSFAYFASAGCRIHEELREREHANERLQQAYSEQKRLSSRLRHFATELTSAEHRARRRFATELQENLQQLLIAARLQLASGPNDPGLKRASEVIDQAVDASRALVRQLRPPALYDVGLLPAVQWLADEMSRRQVLDVRVDYEEESEDDLPSLDDDIRALLFEGVHELLENVWKHSGQSAACVTLRAQGDRIAITVEDHGCGFDAETATSSTSHDVGLFATRERLAELGGELIIDSSIGRGTRVQMAMPRARSTAHRGNRAC